MQARLELMNIIMAQINGYSNIEVLRGLTWSCGLRALPIGRHLLLVVHKNRYAIEIVIKSHSIC